MSPLVYFILAYVLGIFAGRYLSFPLFGSLLVFIVALIFTYLAHRSKYSLVRWLLILFFIFGFINVSAHSGPVYFDLPQFSFLTPIKTNLCKIMPAQQANLLGSVILGDDLFEVNDEVQSIFRKSGLIHLLVVSGTQVSILIGTLLSLFKFTRMPDKLSIAIVSAFNIFLVVITGASASILRAGIMGQILLLALLFERQKDGFIALGVSAFIMLLISPYYLFDIGFLLSFSATFSLLYAVPILSKKMPRIIAISIGPMIFTFPIILYVFGEMSLGSIAANILVLPWVEVLVIFGASAMLLSFILMPLAQVLGAGLWVLLVGLDFMAQVTANLPLSHLAIGNITFVLVIGYYLMLFMLLSSISNEQKLNIKRAMAIGSCFIILHFAFAFSISGLTISVIDVGQGDSILIQTKNHRNVLIDTGDDHHGSRVASFLKTRGIYYLDLMIITHDHADHNGGLKKVSREISVGLLIKQALNQKILLTQDVCLQVLGPDRAHENINDNSIVIKLIYDNFNMLFTGDIELEAIQDLINKNADLRSSILKVSHHGGSTSTTAQFLEKVKPYAGIISVGRWNKYHHPHKSSLSLLNDFGAKVYRTDKQGTITIKSDGNSFMVSTQK